jgi:LysR family transcriptional regulator, glycine cleavage system transcriptional activator
MRMPSLNALRAFEAAARHESFARAASELCVTEGAISRHIKLLEDELGVLLFRRLSRKVELTEQGRHLLPVLAEAFGAIAQAANRVSSHKSDLRVVSGPTIAIRWLVPRLERFRAKHCGFSVQLTTESTALMHVIEGNYDLAINCGSWPNPVFPDGVKAIRLIPQALTPVCSPRLLEGRRLDNVDQLANFDLLHSSPDYFDWKNWAKSFGAPGLDIIRGQTYPNRDMAFRAAVMGEGVTLGEMFVLSEELANGALVAPLAGLVYRNQSLDYYAVVREEMGDDPRIIAFCDWLIEERDAKPGGGRDNHGQGPVPA